MGNVRMRAEQINYGATNVKVALDDLDPVALIALNNRMDKIDAWKATVKTEEKTGAEVTFTNALALAAVSLSAEIEAVQDLHGQSAPYVGGAGKNKFNCTATTQMKNHVTFTINSDGTVSLSGTASDTASVLIGTITLSAGAYVFSGGVDDDIYLNIQTPIYYSKTSETQFTLESETTFSMYATVYRGVNATGKVLKPMIRPASVSDSTFAPYSNICPISGHTSVGIADEGGDNLFTIDESKIGKDYGGGNSAQRWWQTISLPVGTYIFRYGGTISGTYSQLCFGVADSPLPFSDINAHARFTSLRDDTTKYVSITITNEYPYAFVGAIKSSGTITKADIESLQITLRDIATVTVQLGQTVYGGSLNPTTGVLTVTHVIKDLGDLEWAKDGDNRYYYRFAADENMKTWTGDNVGTQISSIYEAISNTQYSQRYKGGINITLSSSCPSFMIYDPTYNDTAVNFGTYVDGQTVCYELATPTTIQLTPTQLQMFKGYNRLSSDGGGDITVEAYTGAAWGGDES